MLTPPSSLTNYSFSIQDEDENSTLSSVLNDEDSKTGLDEDGFEVVTLESDYQVF